MPGKCCIPLCKGEAEDGRKISRFSFPKDPELLKTWMTFIPRVFQPTIHTKICELHFRPQDICRTAEYFDERNNMTLSAPLKHSRLHDGAIPLFFPGTSRESLPSSGIESLLESSMTICDDNPKNSLSKQRLHDSPAPPFFPSTSGESLPSSGFESLLESSMKICDDNPKNPLSQNSDDRPEITVTCADHHDTLIKGLWSFWRINRGVDLYFQWGDRSFEAHQILVDVFFSTEKLCQIASNQTNADQGYLVDSLLEFLYNGTVRIAEDHLEELLALAKQVEFTMLANTLQQIKQTQHYSSVVSTPNHPTPKVDAIPSRRKSASTSKTIPSAANRETSADQQQTNASNQTTGSAVRNSRRLEKLRNKEIDSGETATTLQQRKTTATKNAGSIRKLKPSSNETDCNESAVADQNSTGGATQRKNRAIGRNSKLNTDGNQESRPEDDSMSTSSEENCDKSADDSVPSATQKMKSTIDKKSEQPNLANSRKYPKRSCRSTSTKDAVPDAGEKLPEAAAKRLKELAKELPLPQDVFGDLPVLECPNCDYKTTEFRNYANHVQSAHGRGKPKLRCRLCNFECRSRSEHKAHHSSKHPGEKAFACQFCDKAFNRRSSMREHCASDCAGRVRRPAQTPLCDLCGKTFRNNFVLAEHRRKHTGEKIFVCQTCGKRLATKSGLRGHLLVHSGEKPFVCRSCGRRFAHGTTLKRHMLLHESNPTIHPCSLCTRTFLRPDNLNEHIKQKHADGNVPKNFYKPKTAPQVRTSRRHLREPTCNQCGSSFGHPDDLEQHIKWMHTESYGPIPRKYLNSKQPLPNSRTFACRLCEDVKGGRTEMERHRTAMHPGLKIFGCDQCNYLTSNIPMLDVHTRLHTGERPYKCGMCPRTFRDGSNYRQHMKFHEPSKKPHQCFSCGQAFNLRGNLKFHLKKVHSLTVDEVEAALAGNLPTRESVQEEIERAVVASIMQDVSDGQIVEDNCDQATQNVSLY